MQEQRHSRLMQEQHHRNHQMKKHRNRLKPLRRRLMPVPAF
jgi:hypothetical protein